MDSFNFAEQLLSWFDLDGRKDLPWRIDATPYHVWISEIMLQQTQVSSVIPYYQKFIHRFADVQALALGTQDDVLSHWAGLGYYARARNLHKTAQIIVNKHGGELPADFEALLALPGIGRSTAGAIMALAFHQPYPILDGNVKRVLCRFDAVSGWPQQKTINKQLWQRAQDLLPETRFADYIQAQMDLGATVCTHNQPDCTYCPLKRACQGYQNGKPTDFPIANPNKNRQSTKTSNWLVLLNENHQILLEKRPSSGIWGGLWSFPEFDDTQQIESLCRQRFYVQPVQISARDSFSHVFTHFKLEIFPYLVRCKSIAVAEIDHACWYKTENGIWPGLPAPVKSFLNTIL